MVTRMMTKFVGVLLLGAAMALWFHPSAQANMTFANQTGATCDTCHSAGIDPNKTTLNATGSKYLSCHYNAACAGIGSGAVKPASGPAKQMTSKDFGGVATFNNNCGNQARWIVLMENDGANGVALKLDANQRITVVVTQGTKWTANCGELSAKGTRNYLNLDLVVSP